MILHILLTLALVGLSLLLGAGLYESIVLAPNYERDIPRSLEQARGFFISRTPAHFFRVVSPLTQVLLLGSAIAGWSQPRLRWTAVTALVTLVLTDIITYAFHYPRLRVMFGDPLPADVAPVRKAARQWAAGNWVRIFLLLLSFLMVLHGLIQTGNHMPRMFH